MKIKHFVRIFCCLVVINAFGNMYAQTMVAHDSNFISPAKADRMRRNFKIYIQNPSDENLALAQDVVNALRQDSSKQAFTMALQKKLDAIRANIVQPTTQAARSTPETANIIDTIGVIRTSAVEMANKIIDERISHFEAMQQQKESMLAQLKNNELMLTQLESELESTRISYAQAQETFKAALAREQALTHKEHTIALQEKVRTKQEAEKNKKLNKSLQELVHHIQDLRANNTAMLAQLKNELSSTQLQYKNAQISLAEKSLLIEQEKVVAEKEAEKNKQLCQSVQELEHHIQDLRTNHTMVISKLESRINAAENQAHTFETALEQHVQHLKNERMAQFKNELLFHHLHYNNSRAQRETERNIQHLRTNYEAVITKLESRVNTAERLAHIFEAAQEQHIKNLKHERVAQLKNEFSFIQYSNTHKPLKKALDQEREIAAHERNRARQEAEKNKKLTLCIQQLERNIHNLRTNHEIVISKLESLLRATDNQEHPFETAQALHIKNLKDPRVAWVSAR